MTRTITRILVPTDFSAAADEALDYGKTLASRLGASLHVLHVIEDPYVTSGFSGEFYIPDAPGLREAIRREAEELLAHRLGSLDKQPVPTTTALVFGRSFKTIVEHASEHHIDLIVMGTHGRTGMAHLLMGSVAERVVRTAPCPVLTVRDMPVTTPVAATVSEAVGEALGSAIVI